MQFTQIPNQYAPLGGELRYAVRHETDGDIDIRILDPEDPAPTGAKRFAATASASFDAAPCLRRRLRFIPATGGTGFRAAQGRTVTAFVEAGVSADETVLAPVRTFLPGHAVVSAPGLLTTMPLSRLIPEGACDELTLLTAGACSVTVTAQAADTTTAETFRTVDAGLQLFRLDTRDFPEAESLTVDAGACGTVVYSVIPARQQSRRLAWRSSAGSVEHYTFPVVRTTTLRAEKQRAEGLDGHIVAAAETDREAQLASAYECQPVLEALAEMMASPDVWLAEGDSYTPVDVATDEAVVQRHGSLGCLEVTIRSKRKTRTSWN